MDTNHKASQNTFDLESIIAITLNEEGLETLTRLPKLLVTIIKLLDNENSNTSYKAASILINMTADEKAAEILLNLRNGVAGESVCLVEKLFNIIFQLDNKTSDLCCRVVSNLTVKERTAELVMDALETLDIGFDKIASAFTKKSSNDKSEKFYLGLALTNLSQTRRGRVLILDKEKCVIQRLLPFVEYKENLTCRRGIVGLIRNCCFEFDYHKWLLGEEVNVLPYLLLPLADNTEFDEEDNDKLPIELQYLPEDKEREEDPLIRCMLVECLSLLCAKRENREFLRDKNVYVILRELHKWEKDKRTLAVCENVVNILLRTEEEIGEDDLSRLEVPEHLQDKFDEFDKKVLQED